MELLIDGVLYKLWTPKDEAALENMVKEHAKDIFGEDSIYFDIKPTLRSQAGIGSKPDGYVIVFGDTPQWYIVEVELSSHPLYEHIVSQMTKFSRAINEPYTQKAIVNVMYSEIKNAVFKQALVQNKIGSREIHEFLSSLISSRPILAIVIEEKTKELEEVCSSLPLKTKVVEFKTFVREGVGLAVHAHLFEPLYRPTVTEERPAIGPKGKKKEEARIQDLLDVGLVRANQVIFRDYKGKRYEAEILSSSKIKLFHDGSEWDSLSSAASQIAGTQINGWTWWYTTANGEKILMDILRDKYILL